ncbi:MAG: hypothetical protein V4858_15975 [Pseudomonadota bacterium]
MTDLFIDSRHVPEKIFNEINALQVSWRVILSARTDKPTAKA